MGCDHAPILWLLRDMPASSTRTSVISGMFSALAVMAIVSTYGVVSGVVGVGAGVAIIVEGVLALGALYYLVAGLRGR